MKNFIYFSHQDSFALRTISKLREYENFDYCLTDFFLSENYISSNIKENFSNTVFHTREEAITGFVSSGEKYNLDEVVLKKYAHLEQIFMRMVDFYDFNGRQFTAIERRSLYYANLNYWLALLGKNKVDLVIFGDAPHSPHDVLFAQLCELNRIPILMIRETIIIKGRNFIQKSIFQSPNIFGATEKSLLDDKKIDDDIEDYLEKSRDSNFQFNKILYRRNHALIYPPSNILTSALKSSNLFFNVLVNLRTFFYFFKILAKYFYKKIGSIHLNQTVKFNEKLPDSLKMKRREYAIYPLTELRNENIQIKTDLFKKILRSEYSKYEVGLESEDIEYIYFPLHYQPEATTYPFAGLYMDQEVVIKMVTSLIPKHCKLVIKEHPDTFNLSRESWVRGSYTRDINFYERISRNKNVIFAKMDVSPIALIQGSIATITLTGQSAIQSVINRVPALVFGNAWYQGLEGVLRVSTKEDLAACLSKVFGGYKPSYDKVIDGFRSFALNTFVCDRDSDSRVTALSEEESVETIVRNILLKLS